MKHILSARQFTPDYHAELFEKAEEMRLKRADPDERRVLAQRHLGLGVGIMFYEPSTRTRMSFEFAAGYLGATKAGSENAGEYSSAIKGESIEDTTHTIGKMAAAMVMRHKQTGAADIAAGQNVIPVLNGGDGSGEHPTQALLDLYTIQAEKGRLSGLTVVIGGDLKNGRTARSLAVMLSHYKGNKLRFVSTPDFRIGQDIKDHLAISGTGFSETDDMYTAFEGADAIYWTRLQRERLESIIETEDIPLLPPRYDNAEQAVELMWPHMLSLTQPDEAKPVPAMTPSHFIINQAALQVMEHDTIIMHPLPRVDEIDMSVDADPRAKYFDQVENGLYVRMALLDDILKDV